MLDPISFLRHLQALRDLAAETESYVQEVPAEPAEDSIAARELAMSVDGELAETAFAQGNILTVAVRDHLQALLRSLAEPALTIAPWSNARSTLESAALASWLLDPNVDAVERISRSFAFRHYGMTQQLTLARTSGDPDSLERTTKRLNRIARQAQALGYAPLLTKEGKLSGIGQPMPKMTALVERVLDCAAAYSVLSAMVHAQPWARRQLGFRHVLGGRRPEDHSRQVR